MSNVAIIIILLICIAGFLVALYMLFPSQGPGGMTKSGMTGGLRNNLGSMVASQRETTASIKTGSDRTANVFENAPKIKATNSKMTLSKRLKYAQWRMSPALFRLIEITISIAAFFISGIKLNLMMQIMALFSGPLFMRWLLTFCVERRFKAFDIDYSPFLLSLVGLLKTGMNAMGALEAAAQGLDEGSLVREEVELMLERLRFGVSEDKSIGSFGEDIAHQEIELFVQALLLSRRVGGTLSDTLDRLARQVRRRQYFRSAAHAAIGMQRGSIWFIIGILFALECYLYVVYPESVSGAWAHPMGWQVWQIGVSLIILGIFWVRQVTKMKV